MSTDWKELEPAGFTRGMFGHPTTGTLETGESVKILLPHDRGFASPKTNWVTAPSE